MKLTGAQIIIKCLEERGVDTVTGIPGGSNLKLYDELFKSGIKHVLARHEQGAAFIAQGMARTGNKPAVCLATSGPGATNLITALADAKLDSVPVVAITGQVSRDLMGSDAFQEVNTFEIAKPVTKKSFFVSSIDELEDIMNKAFITATEGRPGPVLIDIPKDILSETAFYGNTFTVSTEKKGCYTIPDFSLIESAAEMINSSHTPVIYAGGGTVSSKAFKELMELSEKNSIPVATSLMGLTSFPRNHGNSLGMIGMHGDRGTNVVLNSADLVISLGSRFGDRTTGSKKTFIKNARLIQIDIDEREIGKNFTPDLGIKGDIRTVLSAINNKIKKNSRTQWMNKIKEIRNDDIPLENQSEKHPREIIERIASAASDDAIITTDVGQHQMWVARTYPFTEKNCFLTSGGLGTMGFGLPAAIGAAMENPEKEVICFTGDGSILMNIQELATLADLDLNIKIVLFNNRELGLVRQQQELFFNGNYSASRFTTSPDFTGLAVNFGIDSADYDTLCSKEDSFNSVFSRKTPVLINCNITQNYNVLPMVHPGKCNTEMIFDNRIENIISEKEVSCEANF